MVEVREIVSLVCAKDHYFRWDDREKCYMVMREKDDRLVARIWLYVEVCDEFKTEMATA